MTIDLHVKCPNDEDSLTERCIAKHLALLLEIFNASCVLGRDDRYKRGSKMTILPMTKRTTKKIMTKTSIKTNMNTRTKINAQIKRQKIIIMTIIMTMKSHIMTPITTKTVKITTMMNVAIMYMKSSWICAIMTKIQHKP